MTEVQAAGVRTFVREAGDGGTPTIFVHGNPDSSLQWLPFLEHAGELGGRVLAPDLPSFGRSERASRFDCTLASYERWFIDLLDALEVDRYRLVVHDWGALALAGALHDPERVQKLVVIDAVPLHAEYRWHWIARLMWRPPVIGELSMPLLNRFTLTQLSRLSSPRPGAQDPAWIKQVSEQMDAGTKRAILALYRSADPDELARAGARLSELSCPALVVWGEGDPYIGVHEARRYAATLPNARLLLVPGAGHWVTREEPSLVDEIVEFLRVPPGEHPPDGG